jgi:4-hydroxy-2-oxoheptanedioate aldolase
MGVMMPGLESVEEIRMLANAVKYAPVGKRGMGFARAAAYAALGKQAIDYINFTNEETMVIPQFEDAALIDRFEEMIAQPGVDVVVIGPRDLSLNMGFPDGPNHPEVQEMIDRVIALCKRKGVAAGITAATRVDATHQVSRGARMILTTAQGVILFGSKDFLPA